MLYDIQYSRYNLCLFISIFKLLGATTFLRSRGILLYGLTRSNSWTNALIRISMCSGVFVCLFVWRERWFFGFWFWWNCWPSLSDLTLYNSYSSPTSGASPDTWFHLLVFSWIHVTQSLVLCECRSLFVLCPFTREKYNISRKNLLSPDY